MEFGTRLPIAALYCPNLGYRLPIDMSTGSENMDDFSKVLNAPPINFAKRHPCDKCWLPFVIPKPCGYTDKFQIISWLTGGFNSNRSHQISLLLNKLQLINWKIPRCSIPFLPERLMSMSQKTEIETNFHSNF